MAGNYTMASQKQVGKTALLGFVFVVRRGLRLT